MIDWAGLAFVLIAMGGLAVSLALLSISGRIKNARDRARLLVMTAVLAIASLGLLRVRVAERMG